jgi:hypothetical protein
MAPCVPAPSTMVVFVLVDRDLRLAEILGDGPTAAEDRDVLEHGLAAIAEAQGLDRRHVKGAAQLLDHEGRQRFAVHVFRDDHGMRRPMVDALGVQDALVKQMLIELQAPGPTAELFTPSSSFPHHFVTTRVQ